MKSRNVNRPGRSRALTWAFALLVGVCGCQTPEPAAPPRTPVDPPGTSAAHVADPTEIVTAYCAALEAGDIDKAASYLADDFELAGTGPRPMPKTMFVAFQRAQRAALPDLAFNWKILEAKGNELRLSMHVTGTHSGELSYPFPGVPKVPPTGKRVDLPEEQIDVTVEDGKVRRAHAHIPPGGGVAAMLSQIGAAKSPADSPEKPSH